MVLRRPHRQHRIRLPAHDVAVRVASYLSTRLRVRVCRPVGLLVVCCMVISCPFPFLPFPIAHVRFDQHSTDNNNKENRTRNGSMGLTREERLEGFTVEAGAMTVYRKKFD